MPRCPSAPRRAFTLIELLVVIAIIALLIGILLPALGAARSASKLVQCTSNIRSIGQGLGTYTGEQRGRFPHWSGWQIYGGNGTPPDSPGPGWTELLADYLAGVQIFRDPVRDRDLAPFSYFLSSKWVYAQTGQAYTSLRDTQVQLTSQFILAGDCNQPLLYPQPYGTSVLPPDCDQDDASNPGVFFPGQLLPHAGATNLLFADQHAAVFKQFEPDRMTFHGNRMTDWTLQ